MRSVEQASKNVVRRGSVFYTVQYDYDLQPPSDLNAVSNHKVETFRL